MSRETLNMHLIWWHWEFEPGERINNLPPPESSTQEQKDKSQNARVVEKPTVRVGDRVYKKIDGRTAIVEDATVNPSEKEKRILIRYDINNKTERPERKDWHSKNLPFPSAMGLVPLSGRVKGSESKIGILIGNIIEPPPFMDGFLRPISYSSTGSKYEVIEKCVQDKTQVNPEQTAFEYTYDLKAMIPEDILNPKGWKKLYYESLDLFLNKGLKCVAIPHAYDLCPVEDEIDLTELAFETAILWAKRHPTCGMDINLMCTNINEYKRYRELFEEYSGNETLIEAAHLKHEKQNENTGVQIETSTAQIHT